MGNAAEVWPDPMVTLFGTVAMKTLSEKRLITAPVGGAGGSSVTIPVVSFPPQAKFWLMLSVRDGSGDHMGWALESIILSRFLSGGFTSDVAEHNSVSNRLKVAISFTNVLTPRFVRRGG